MTVKSQGAGTSAAKILIGGGVPDNSDAINGILYADISTVPPTLYIATGGAFVALGGNAPVGSAEITVAANTTPMTLTTINTYYRWETGWNDDTTAVGFTRDLTHGVLTAQVAARIFTAVLVNISCNTVTGLHISLFKNNAPVPEHLLTFDVVNVNDAVAVTISGIDDCGVGDAYDVRIEDTGHSGSTVIVYNANFSVFVIGNSP